MAELTALVPAYRAASFITDTLDGLARQTFTDLDILISIDPSEDDTEAVCRRYLVDPRFRVIVQPSRLGWVGNVNALLARVETPYFCLIPHDDVPAPAYCERLMRALRERPSASCAYSDIAGFGCWESHIEQPGLTGPLLERTVEFLLDHFSAVAFRGVVARERLSTAPHLPIGLLGDFAADTVWVLDLALDGDLCRVPEALYAKRYAPTTVHARWFEEPRDEIIARWSEHAAACTRAALTRISDRDERTIITAAGLLRASGAGGVRHQVFSPQDEGESAAAVDRFCADLGTTPEIVARACAHPRASALTAAVDEHAARRRRSHPILQLLRRVIGR